MREMTRDLCQTAVCVGTGPLLTCTMVASAATPAKRSSDEQSSLARTRATVARESLSVRCLSTPGEDVRSAGLRNVCQSIGMTGSWVLSDEQCEIRIGKRKKRDILNERQIVFDQEDYSDNDNSHGNSSPSVSPMLLLSRRSSTMTRGNTLPVR